MEFKSAAEFNISVTLDSIGILKSRKLYLHSCNLKEFVIVSGQQQKPLNYFLIAIGEPVQFLSTSMGLSVMMFQGFVPHGKNPDWDPGFQVPFEKQWKCFEEILWNDPCIMQSGLTRMEKILKIVRSVMFSESSLKL